MADTTWTLRYTKARNELIERLREKLKRAGRKVDTVHGVITNSAVFDHALAALEKELDQELADKPKG